LKDYAFLFPNPFSTPLYYTSSAKGKLQTIIYKTGLAQKHLNVKAVRNILIPLPSIQEQEQIVNVIKSVAHNIKQIKENKEKLCQLKKYLIKRLFLSEI